MLHVVIGRIAAEVAGEAACEQSFEVVKRQPQLIERRAWKRIGKQLAPRAKESAAVQICNHDSERVALGMKLVGVVAWQHAVGHVNLVESERLLVVDHHAGDRHDQQPQAGHQTAHQMDPP